MPSTPYKPVFALADVNSMYCSCERAYRPDLRYKPIAVLSNCDGCVIAQTIELKELGIDMAQPWFEVEEAARKLGVVVFSSNYELYADFSNRFVETLRHFAPRVEVYSIDECFLDLTGMKRDLNVLGHVIKDTVLQWTTLPICVGIGHSKTLAKLANKVAKKQVQFNGVCDFTSMSATELDALLETLDIEKVWGVGRQLTARLNKLGVHNVLRLKRASPKRVRDEFGVVLERTVMELNGESWLELTEVAPPGKQIMSSRSFGKRVTTRHELEEAITFHASNAAARLRDQGQYATVVHCFIQNSPFDKVPFYGPPITMALPSPTDCSFKITQAALYLMKQIYRPGIYYQKAGVMLMELVPAEGQQTDLFGFSAKNEKTKQLMTTLDRINDKYGRGSMRLAAEGTKKSWAMRRSYMSPNYTGSWKELPIIGQPFAI